MTKVFKTLIDKGWAMININKHLSLNDLYARAPWVHVMDSIKFGHVANKATLGTKSEIGRFKACNDWKHMFVHNAFGLKIVSRTTSTKSPPSFFFVHIQKNCIWLTKLWKNQDLWMIFEVVRGFNKEFSL